VFIKQAKELEKTYFVLLEKLRDPYFARIFIGIPAILILLFSLSSYLGFGWQPVGVIVGLYLLLRIFGADELAIGLMRDFRVSFERTSWIGYVGAAAIFVIALVVGYQTTQQGISLNLPPDELISFVAGSTVWIALIGLLMIMGGKMFDELSERKVYAATKYLVYSSAALIITIVILVGSQWIVNMNPPYVDFPTFLLTVAVCMALGYFAVWIINRYRKEILIDMKIDGKEAISENGVYLGKIVGVDAKKGRLVIQTVFEKKFTLPVTAVVSVEDNVVVKSSE
jgi:uncharacterized membrane protein